MYDDGAGVPRDGARAVAWFERGAELRDRDSEFCLANILFDGRGVDPDPTRAVEVLEQAAGGMHPDPNHLLALMTFRGEGRLCRPGAREEPLPPRCRRPAPSLSLHDPRGGSAPLQARRPPPTRPEGLDRRDGCRPGGVDRRVGPRPRPPLLERGRGPLRGSALREGAHARRRCQGERARGRLPLPRAPARRGRSRGDGVAREGRLFRPSGSPAVASPSASSRPTARPGRTRASWACSMAPPTAATSAPASSSSTSSGAPACRPTPARPNASTPPRRCAEEGGVMGEEIFEY
ncbi:MAG: sel1 repeat family protein [Holophagales bacterium]|nr:sel1 repeat family protein [Holophagales bacterium]